jgi:UDP-N-acetyl-D-mannosaminuronic acid dehydrogenase
MKNHITDQNICIFGMGYVGVTLAVVMAEAGFKVLGLEINDEILKQLKAGTPHFYEAGLDARLKAVVANGHLRFAKSLAEDPHVSDINVYILSVGTPLSNNSKHPRMDMIETVTKDIAQHMSPDSLIILRSTVVIGTTKKVVLPLLKESGLPFDLAYCPERTLEGKALKELTYLPQIVGGIDTKSAWRATQLFQHLTPTTIRVSSLESAEVIKLLDNSYRDLSFAFGNEVALLCEAANLDAIEIINAANTGYERTSIALPGFVGGPCLEKDPHILEYSLEKYNHKTKLISAGRKLNEDLVSNITNLITHSISDESKLESPTIAICGLAFKGQPETSDLRGTVAIPLLKYLRNKFPKATIKGQDFAVKNPEILDMGLIPSSIEEAFKETDILIVCNNNQKYQALDGNRMAETMNDNAIIFDVWNILSINKATHSNGVKYRRLGSCNAMDSQSNSNLDNVTK